MSNFLAGSFVSAGDAVLQIHQVYHRTKQLFGYDVKSLKYILVDMADAVEIEEPDFLFNNEWDNVLAVNSDRTRAEPAKRLRDDEGGDPGAGKRIVVRLETGDNQVVSVPATRVVADVSATPLSRDLLVALVRAGTFTVEEIGRLARTDKYYNRLANLDDVWAYFLERDFPDVYAHYVTVKTGKLVPLISIALDAYTSDPAKRGADRRVCKRFYEFLAKQKTHPDAVHLLSKEYQSRLRSLKMLNVFQCNESVYVVFQPEPTDNIIRRFPYTMDIASILNTGNRIDEMGVQVWRSNDTYASHNAYQGIEILAFNQDGFVFRPSVPVEGSTPLYYHNEITKTITRFYEIEQGWRHVTVFLLKSGIVVTLKFNIPGPNSQYTLVFPKHLAGEVDVYRVDGVYKRNFIVPVRYASADTLLSFSLTTLILPHKYDFKYDPLHAYEKGVLIYDRTQTKSFYLSMDAIPASTTPHVLDRQHGWKFIPEKNVPAIRDWARRLPPTFPRLKPFHVILELKIDDVKGLQILKVQDVILEDEWFTWSFQQGNAFHSVKSFFNLHKAYGGSFLMCPVISPANGGFVQYFFSPKKGEFTVKTLESTSIHRPHHLDLVSACAECLQPNVIVKCSDARCILQGKAFCSQKCGQQHLQRTHVK